MTLPEITINAVRTTEPVAYGPAGFGPQEINGQPTVYQVRVDGKPHWFRVMEWVFPGGSVQWIRYGKTGRTIITHNRTGL